tara:strand:+ start:1220 stop:3043 length:1824 start_codon:yes stop_codon:yes gene_type:complete
MKFYKTSIKTILFYTLILPIFLKGSIITSSGVVIGIEQNEVISWKNIPYAMPPTKDLRWMAPKPINDSSIVIDQLNANGCVQEPSRYAGMSGEDIVGSEDCLYLDIKSPKYSLTSASPSKVRKYPVMFWIHGGGNTTGYKDYYDFSELVRQQQVVVVTINYRLGPFGWFRHPAIQNLQTGIDQTSNFGTLDIIEALRWVKNNISKFGGDANNITIFGESAGGHNVLSLLVAPQAKDLFQKAISQSGYTTSYTKEEALGKNNIQQLNDLGSLSVFNDINVSSLSDGKIKDFNNEDLEIQRKFLKSLSAKSIMQLYLDAEKNTQDYMPLLNRDDIVISSNGLLRDLADTNLSKNIPVILGSNKDELSLWLGVHRYFVKVIYPFTKLIPIPRIKILDQDLYTSWVKIRSDAWKYRGVDEPLIALEKAGYSELFAYRFDWDDQRRSFYANTPKLLGASHGVEIAFLTGDFQYGPVTRYVYPNNDAREQMEHTMMKAWSSFARNGKPSIESIDWLKFDSNARSFLKLDKDKDIRNISDANKDLLSILTFDDFSGTDLEKCLLVYEVFTNVGDRLYNDFLKWNDGYCTKYNIQKERKAIENTIVEKYGKLTIF